MFIPASNKELPDHELLVVFAHGKESGPWGSKIQHLAAIARTFGAVVLSPDYSDLMDADVRVKRLEALSLPASRHLVLVGSSMGGYVSTVVSRQLKPDGLFLMAPAFYLPVYREQNPQSFGTKTAVVHGWNDVIVPVENSIQFAQKCHAALHVLNGDHRLDSVLTEVGDLFRRFIAEIISE